MNQLKYLLILVFTTVLFSRELNINDQSSIVFASINDGKKVLGSSDDFVSRMSEFDRSSRLKTDQQVSTDKYLKFVESCVQAWSDSEVVRVTKIIEDIKERLNELQVPLPARIDLIKTDGKEEGNAPYTRGNAIVIPASELRESDEKIRKTICHEFFHIITRNNSTLKDKMYESIGFHKKEELKFPQILEKRKITNPDAPLNNYCIKVKVMGKEEWVIPILFSKSDKYNVQVGGEFFNYLQFVFLVVEPDQDSNLIYDNDNLKVVSISQISGFFEQVGQNTEYIIHPEEILADNFAFLILGKTDIPSTEITKSMEQIFREYQTITMKNN